MANAKRSILVEILGDAKNYAKASKQAESATTAFEKKVDAVGKALAFAYTAKKVIDFGIASVKAAADDAAAQKVLATTLRNTTAATDEQIASIEKWITNTSHQTGFLDDDLRPSLSSLLRVTKDQTKAQDLLNLAMDVSRGTGNDLQSTSTAIAKAYAGNTTALGKMIPGIKVAGEGTLTFATAQQRLNQQFSGQAAAYADTAQGRMERINAQYKDMQETIGQALLPVMEQLVGVVASVFGWFNQLDPQTQDLIVKLGLLAGGLYVGVSAFNAISDAVKVLGITTESTMPWLAALGIAAGALVSISSSWSSSNEDLEQRTGQVSKALGAEIDKVVELAQKSGTATTATSALEMAQIALSNALTGSDENGQKTSAALGTLGLQGTDAAKVMSLIAAESYKGADGLMYANKAIDAQIKAMLTAEGYTSDMADTLIFLMYQGYDAGGMWDVTKEKISDWTDEQKAAAAAAVELGRQSKDVDLSAISSDYLNAEVATNAYRESLVVAAEAQTGFSRNSDHSQDVLAAYIDLLGNLTPEQQKLAAGIDVTAAATGKLASSQDELVKATDRASAAAETTRSKLSDEAQAASDLKAAIDAIFAPYMNMEDAQRAVAEGSQKLVDQFSAVDEKGRKLGSTLDVNTQRGRENRAAIEDQVKSILNYGVAMVGSGSSTEEAAAKVDTMTGNLKDQLKMLGLNDDEINTYLNSLGLTPENIQTTVTLAKADVTKRQLEDMLSQLDDVDAGAVAEIKADIARGDFATAQAKIDELAKERNVTLKVGLTGGGVVDLTTIGSKVYVKAHKRGGVTEGGTVLVGEEGPELADLPRGTRITPAGETSRILSAGAGRGSRGGDVHYHAHVSAGVVVSERELESVIADSLSKASRRQGRDVTTRSRVPI